MRITVNKSGTGVHLQLFCKEAELRPEGGARRGSAEGSAEGERGGGARRGSAEGERGGGVRRGSAEGEGLLPLLGVREGLLWHTTT